MSRGYPPECVLNCMFNDSERCALITAPRVLMDRRGAMICHDFRKVIGRPPTVKNARRVSLTVDGEQWDKMGEITDAGHGRGARGKIIREFIKEFNDDKTTK